MDSETHTTRYIYSIILLYTHIYIHNVIKKYNIYKSYYQQSLRKYRVQLEAYNIFNLPNISKYTSILSWSFAVKFPVQFTTVSPTTSKVSGWGLRLDFMGC